MKEPTTTRIEQAGNGETVQVEVKRPIGAATPIQLGLLITLIGGIFSGGWVLSGINTKLDVLVGQFRDLKGSNDGLSKIVADHQQEDNRQWNEIKGRVLSLETVGSPALRDMNKEHQELKARMDIFERTHKP